MKFYWFKFGLPGLPVELPAMPRHARRFRWTGLYGVQIGSWFFGAIKGDAVSIPRKQGAE